jgi:hypothetical protein
MADMFDSLPDDEKGEAVVSTIADIAKIEKNILAVTITEMKITTAEERGEANEIMGGFIKCEKQIKTFEATHLAPKKAVVAEIVSEVKPYKNQIASLIKIVKSATKTWDLKVAQEARAKQQAEAHRVEEERAKAVKEMLENKKKGDKTLVETLEKVKAVAPPVGSVKVETARGTSSGKLGTVWFIMTKGVEWDKKSRLPLFDVDGHTGGNHYACVDTVQINEEFKVSGREHFPEWIQTREEIINSKFNV